MDKDLLFEIGTEELPARFIPGALRSLKELAEKKFSDAQLSFKEIKTVGTPRRLALLVKGLAIKGKDQTQESFGPAFDKAKDKEGKWTSAALGFARSQGTSPDKLKIRETSKGKRLCFEHHLEGVSTEKILPEFLLYCIQKISFPKGMVWEKSCLTFARPIRWIVALYGEKVIKLEVAGVKSGKKTYGLMVQTSKPIDISSPSKYISHLKNHCIVVDSSDRRERIEKQISQTLKNVQGEVYFEKNSDLMEEVINLVEHPVSILGHFDERYLSLPIEVLTTSMVKHQKFFPVYEEKKSTSTQMKNSLLPCFVGIRNGISENQSVVRQGYERVLAARLADAAFFYKQDKKVPLENSVEKLRGITFLNPLTLFDKVQRVRNLIRLLSKKLGIDEKEQETADRIALLSKVDLVTHMVGEFPELQGVMGRLYAQSSESAVVADGILQHYWPVATDGPLPDSTPASLVALADKIDSLAALFLIGNRPSGSQDPYGHRRASAGVLRILRQRKWTVSLKEILNEALSPETLSLSNKEKQEKTVPLLLDFFQQRWTILMESEGYRFDEIQAVFQVDFTDIIETEKRLSALHKMRKHPDFSTLSAAYKRANNILTQAAKKHSWSMDQEFSEGDKLSQKLKESTEKEFYLKIIEVKKKTEPLLSAQLYEDVLKAFVGLKTQLDQFFDSVMIMAPEEDLRRARLSLLSLFTKLFAQVLNFSVLQDVPTENPKS